MTQDTGSRASDKMAATPHVMGTIAEANAKARDECSFQFPIAKPTRYPAAAGIKAATRLKPQAKMTMPIGTTALARIVATSRATNFSIET